MFSSCLLSHKTDHVGYKWNNSISIFYQYVPLMTTVKWHLAMFPMWSSAMYLTAVSPMGKRLGGSTAGTTVTEGRNPELSKANGTIQSTSAVLSVSSASTTISNGQCRRGASVSEICKRIWMNKHLACYNNLILRIPMTLLPQLLISTLVQIYLVVLISHDGRDMVTIGHNELSAQVT